MRFKSLDRKKEFVRKKKFPAGKEGDGDAGMKTAARIGERLRREIGRERGQTDAQSIQARVGERKTCV